MDSISNDFSRQFWTTFQIGLIPLGILALTVLLAVITRNVLKRLVAKKRFVILQGISPSVMALVHIVGLTMMIESIPLHPKVYSWLDHGLYIASVLALLSIARHVAWSIVSWSSLRANNSPEFQKGFIPLLKNVVTLFIFTMGAIMILKHFNYDVLSLLTALGVGSLAVGLASKDTLSNMISGFTLIIDRNLMPGDRMNLSGPIGKVMAIGIRSTRVALEDGNTLIVPNAELVNTKILILNQSVEVECKTTFRIAMDEDYARVKAICLRAMEKVPTALSHRDKWVRLSQLPEGSEQMTCAVWIKDSTQGDLTIASLNGRIIEELKKEGIKLSRPAQAL